MTTPSAKIQDDGMRFTVAILVTILAYTWLLEPHGVRVGVPAVIVVAITVLNGLRTGEWGLSRAALLPAARAAALFTVTGVSFVLGIGLVLGSLHYQGGSLSDLALLIPWGTGQQWVLQTLVLREARGLTSRKKSVIVAATLFAVVHAPNPLLMIMTFAGAVGWCAIYARHPNILPLGVSHAVATIALLYSFDANLTGHLRIGHAYLRVMR